MFNTDYKLRSSAIRTHKKGTLTMSSEKDNASAIKGIKISTINTVIIITSFALCLLFVLTSFQIRKEYITISGAADSGIEYIKNAQMAKEGSYYLTEQVYLYVATGDKQYADNYFTEANITRRRETAIENLEADLDAEVYSSLTAAMESSNNLMNREIYAIRLIAESKGDDIFQYDPKVYNCALNSADAALSPEEKHDLAYSLVFDDSYLTYRNDIDTKIQTFVDSIYTSSEISKRVNHNKLMSTIVMQYIFILCIFVLNIVFFFVISRLILTPLKSNIERIGEGKTFELHGAYELQYLAQTYNRIFHVYRENERSLRHQAEHDFITGLLNKGSFDKFAKQYSNTDIPIALLIIDIDCFKHVNDTYGHVIGDEVIENVASLILRSFRSSDIVARVGGDEFAVIMKNVTSDMSTKIRSKINTLNERLKNPANNLPCVTLSVGIAFSEYGYSDALFDNADKALYQVKKERTL